jgi:hypothetical protein
VKAKHLLLFLDAFDCDSEVTGSAKGLQTKYSASCHTFTCLSLGKDIKAYGETGTVKNDAKAAEDFPTRVGVYVITHMNNPFHVYGAKVVAENICNYLDARQDLGIDCTHLDKAALMTCAGSVDLKHNFQDKDKLKEINKFAEKQDRFYKDYTNAAKEWDQKRQVYLDKVTNQYEKDKDNFFKEDTKAEQDFDFQFGQHMLQFACALDARGAHPKIAAWDSSLFGNPDGTKSIHRAGGNPVERHQRLLHKMMIQFVRNNSGPAHIRQLGLQEWSDKPLKFPASK